MRDYLLNESLKRLAAEAATRFTTLVASGDQIPFDVTENAGSDSVFHSYRPLTSQFVRERAEELRSLLSFEPARDAAEAAGVAAPFLEQRGAVVPSQPAEAAEAMLIAFIADLWEGCAEFSLDRARLDAALAVLDAEVRDVNDADVLIVPIVGLRMSTPRLRFPTGIELKRADLIDAPAEAMRSEGMRRAAWEPQFLAVAPQEEEPGSAGDALRQLRELITVMRVFKSGGIGLGPYAFAPTGEGRWRHLATGASVGRPGGYELSAEEAAEAADLAAAVDARPDPDAALSWAVRRFEMGCERTSALDGLSDNLLALRAVLEGSGPVGATLPMRAAALMASEVVDRRAAHERIEQALGLERSLMSGSSSDGAAELAAWIEEGVRWILRDALLGELGGDLGTAADETLIATGLAEGDAQISVTVQVEPDPSTPGPDPSRGSESEPPAIEDMPVIEAESDPPYPPPEHHMEEQMEDDDTRILEPIPAEDEIRITATNWLDEVSTAGQTLEWPAGREPTAQRERIDTPRVRHLFPVPEDADWEVRELDYDHYNRRAG